MPAADDRFERYQKSLQLGHEELRRGRLKQALEQYHAASRVAEERPLPHVLVGGVLLRMGRRKEALAAYDRAVELDGNDVAALTGRAAALRASGRGADADAALERVAAIQKRAEAAQLSAAIAEAGASGRPEAQLMLAERALEQGDRQQAISAWLAAANAYSSDGHLDAALDTCLRALLVDTGAPRVHLELCRLYIAKGWRDRAVDHVVLLDRLLALAPDAPLRRQLAALAAAHSELDPRVATVAGAAG